MSMLRCFDPVLTSRIVCEASLEALEMLVRCFKDTQRALLKVSSPIGSEKQFQTLAKFRFYNFGRAGGRGRNGLLLTASDMPPPPPINYLSFKTG